MAAAFASILPNMIPSHIRAIFFDAVGTLIHPDPAAAVIYAQVGRCFGSRYTTEEISTRFSAAFRREEALDVAGDWRTSEERERRRWHNIVRTVLDDVGEPEACFHELYEHFALPAAWRLSTNAAAAIQQLAGRGYRLGLASNYDHRLHAVTAGFPALRALTHVVISSEVGWRKPARQFFAAMCQAAQLPAAQVLYVGDDPANDYDGAIAAGLQALLVDPNIRANTDAASPWSALALLGTAAYNAGPVGPCAG
jgi:putative hydrolase of the HAD superfamily